MNNIAFKKKFQIGKSIYFLIFLNKKNHIANSNLKSHNSVITQLTIKVKPI